MVKNTEIFEDKDMINFKKFNYENKFIGGQIGSSSPEGPQSVIGATANLLKEMTMGVVRIANVLTTNTIKNANNTGEAFAKMSAYTIGTYVDNSLEFMLNATMGNEFSNKSIQELSQISIDKMKKLTEVSREIVKDPKAQEIFREIGVLIGDVLENVMMTAREPLKKVTVTAITMGREVGGETLSGITKFGVDMVSVLLSEIPVVGGVVDLTIAVGRAFNASMKAFKDGTRNSIMMMNIMNKLISDILPPIDLFVTKGLVTKNKLSGFAKKVVDTMNSTSNSISSTKVGGKKNKKKKHDIIDDILRKTIKGGKKIKCHRKRTIKRR